MYSKIISFLIIAILTLPAIVLAQQMPSLIDMPWQNSRQAGLAGYIETIYIASISIAALLAVMKIIIAGVKYMLTDVVTTKGDAKKDITTSLLGLLLIISAVLILNTINPSIADLQLTIDEIEEVDTSNVTIRFATLLPKGSTTGQAQQTTLSLNNPEDLKVMASKTPLPIPESSSSSKYSTLDLGEQIIECVTSVAKEFIIPRDPDVQDPCVQSYRLDSIHYKHIGNMATYDMDEYCNARFKNKDDLTEYLEDCRSRVEMLWNDNIRTGTLDFDGGFCEDNGGRIGKETVESKKVLKCELPTRVIPKTEIDQKRQESGISAGVSGFKQTCKAAGYNPSFRDLAMSGEDRDDLANWSCNAYD